jgi:alpha-tubulin suppressor-like RCC1 family protein
LGSNPLSPVANVSVGLGQVCALKTDGTVWCWGSDPFLQSDAGLVLSPTQVMGLP